MGRIPRMPKKIIAQFQSADGLGVEEPILYPPRKYLYRAVIYKSAWPVGVVNSSEKPVGEMTREFCGLKHVVPVLSREYEFQDIIGGKAIYVERPAAPDTKEAK